MTRYEFTDREVEALIRCAQLAASTYADSARLFREEPPSEDIARDYDKRAAQARALVLRLAKLDAEQP
jgi:hypothetical protein